VLRPAFACPFGQLRFTFNDFREVLYTIFRHPIPIVVLSYPQLFHKQGCTGLFPASFFTNRSGCNRRMLSLAGFATRSELTADSADVAGFRGAVLN
jgi:hypothetical protein